MFWLRTLSIFFVAFQLAAAPTNLSTAKKAVRNYYESGAFDTDVQEAVDKGIALFKARVAHPSLKEVIIFDIDETALSNYKDIESIDFGYIPTLWHEWMLRGDAPAIKAVKQLYDFLVSQGYLIIFITGRKQNEFAATRKNLINQGFTTFEKLIVRSEPERTLSSYDYKTKARKKLAESGYTIVGSVGDQGCDISGDNVGIGVVIPNALYKIDAGDTRCIDV